MGITGTWIYGPDRFSSIACTQGENTQHRNLRHNFGFVREQRAAATKHGGRELRVTTNNDI